VVAGLAVVVVIGIPGQAADEKPKDTAKAAADVALTRLKSGQKWEVVAKVIAPPPAKDIAPPAKAVKAAVRVAAAPPGRHAGVSTPAPDPNGPNSCVQRVSPVL